MGSDPLSYATFLRQYCCVRVRDWQTDEDWKKENEKLKEIIKWLEDNA